MCVFFVLSEEGIGCAYEFLKKSKEIQLVTLVSDNNIISCLLSFRKDAISKTEKSRRNKKKTKLDINKKNTILQNLKVNIDTPSIFVESLGKVSAVNN